MTAELVLDGRLVFVRTAKGEDEFQHRSHQLAQALRFVLIMIDGKSSVTRLHERGGHLTDVPKALEALVDGGYISTVEEAGRKGGAVGDPKAELIVLARMMFGEDSGKVIKKVQDAGDTHQALSEAVDSCRKIIKLFIDEHRADEFARRAKEILYAAARAA